MGVLAEREARAALQMLTAVSAAIADGDGFARAGVRSLSTLLGADLTTLSICNLDSGQRRVTGFPDRALSGADIACFDRHFHGHPLVRFHAGHPDAGTHRISDSLSRVSFERSALYDEYYRKIGIGYVAAVPLWVDDRTLVSFVLNRSHRDFTDDECLTLEAVRVPLRTLYRQAHALDRARATAARFRAWITAEGWCEIELDATLRVRRASRHALALLGMAIPDSGLRLGTTVPPIVVTWLRRGRATGPAGRVLALAAGGRAFALRALPAADDGGWLVYVGEQQVGAPAAAHPLLSPREVDVLGWVRAGKSDAQVAAILGISVRTVQKHLEHIYVKLGVEGRTAAVMRGWQRN